MSNDSEQQEPQVGVAFPPEKPHEPEHSHPTPSEEEDHGKNKMQEDQEDFDKIVEVPPNNTIYINNINEKVKKETLKKDLYSMFSRFGQILDVVCCKTQRLRGQAWIIFDDLSSAVSAKKAMDEFIYRDKPFNVEFSKTKSDLIALREGTSVDKEKRKAEKRKRQKEDVEQREQKRRLLAARSYPSNVPANIIAMQPAERQEPPNKVLFVDNLPSVANDQMMGKLFSQFQGYKDARIAPGGLAFVEYDSEMEAALALQAMQGFKVTADHALRISFAKK